MIGKFDKKLTIKQAARILGVTPLTLRNWDKIGKLIAFRNPNNNYRIYTLMQLRNFLARGAKGKIVLRWGYDESIKCREEEIEQALFTIDAIVSPEATNIDEKSDEFLHKLNTQTRRRGVKFRFIRDLSDNLMRTRADVLAKTGNVTRDCKIRGLSFSVRDKNVTRIEIPTDDAKERLNIIIYDKKVAKVFKKLFDSLWVEQ